MFSKFIPSLPEMLLEPGAWHPYPTSNERAGWDRLARQVRQDLVERGEASLDYAWPGLPASLFLEYARMGNRSDYEKVHFDRRYRLADLLLAECAEGMGRFLDDIANGIWAICEETYWGVPAHVGVQKSGVGLPDASEPTVDLFVGETVALLAWTDYLLGTRLDIVSPLLRQRIRLEAKRRVLDPCLERDDFWWMSFDPGEHSINNWNPWVNSNWLAAVLLLESDRERQVAAVSKILRSLDLFIATYGEAGGCDEGPGYWGRAAASLFDCLELLFDASKGKLNFYDQVRIQNMGRYIYRAHIGEDYYVNFADASAVNQPSAGLVFRYGERIGDPAMMGFGAWLAERASPSIWTQRDSLTRRLPVLFNLEALQAATPAQPLPLAFWFDDIQVLVARECGGSTEGLFLAAKGGHNAESHNHNDIGNFIIYAHGLPLVIDAGVETYTRKTFSPQRYEIWTMQSAYHNLLPSIRNAAGDWMQAPGREYAARAVVCRLSREEDSLAFDLAGAYPPAAGLQRWIRVVRLLRGEGVIVEDEFEFGQPAHEVRLSLLTPAMPDLSEPGVVRFQTTLFGVGRVSGDGEVRYPAPVFSVSFEKITITDERLGGVWGEALNRVEFSASAPPLNGRWQFRLTT
jgi:hypothetical protein